MTVELQSLYKSYFYIASAVIEVQIFYLLGFILNPIDRGFLYASVIVLSITIPMLVGVCLGAICGYMEPLKHLLFGGLWLSVVWFALILMSYSILAGMLFLVVSLVSYKMLQYHHIDEKAKRENSQGTDEE